MFKVEIIVYVTNVSDNKISMSQHTFLITSRQFTYNELINAKYWHTI